MHTNPSMSAILSNNPNWENHKNCSSETKITCNTTSSDQNQSNNPAAPKIQLPLNPPFPFLSFPCLSSTFNSFQHPNSFHRIDTNAIISNFYRNSHKFHTQPSSEASVWPHPSLLPRPIWSPHIKFRHQNAPSCRFSVHGLFPQFFDCAIVSRAFVRKRQTSTTAENKRKERRTNRKSRSARAALPWGWGCRPGPRVGPKRSDMYLRWT